MSKYAVTVTREGKWWMVSIPKIDGLTQARRLGEAELMARELIAVTQDIPLADVHVEVTLALEGQLVNVVERVSDIAANRDEAATLERNAKRKAAALARTLNDGGIPVRDIGAILGVSHQRAHQLLRT